MRFLTRLLLLVSLMSPPVAAETVTVFAAASLKTALEEIAPLWEAESGHDLRLSLAGSALLARQIAQGAEADLYLSANQRWMDHLEDRGLLAEGTRHDLLSNRLVLIGYEATPTTLADLTDRLAAGGHLALALTEAVPAGIYARAALETLGLWSALHPAVVEADNVRAALALVALGQADYGIVYASDLAATTEVHALAVIPADTHPPILYPVAALNDRAVTQDFLRYVTGPEARAVFEAQGFLWKGAP